MLDAYPSNLLQVGSTSSRDENGSQRHNEAKIPLLAALLCVCVRHPNRTISMVCPVTGYPPARTTTVLVVQYAECRLIARQIYLHVRYNTDCDYRMIAVMFLDLEG